jgi:thiol:disulfide interchange protein DsbA
VPSFIVNGQFITSSTMAGGNEQALKTVDFIVANIRASKTKTTTPTKK